MFVGGYVSAAGLGLTCPEWPLCPSGVLPNEEYLIEWIHRFVAATTGTLVIATSVASWINKNAGRKIKFTSTFAATLVVFSVCATTALFNFVKIKDFDTNHFFPISQQIHCVGSVLLGI